MKNKSLSFEKDKLGLIAGPCVIENEEHAIFMAKSIKEICNKVEIDVVYKSSFDKANSCLLYTSPSPRDATLSRMPSSA